jgi:hypothetical protein
MKNIKRFEDLINEGNIPPLESMNLKASSSNELNNIFKKEIGPFLVSCMPGSSSRALKDVLACFASPLVVHVGDGELLSPSDLDNMSSSMSGGRDVMVIFDINRANRETLKWIMKAVANPENFPQQMVLLSDGETEHATFLTNRMTTVQYS